jgi:hypothetical protein
MDWYATLALVAGLLLIASMGAVAAGRRRTDGERETPSDERTGGASGDRSDTVAADSNGADGRGRVRREMGGDDRERAGPAITEDDRERMRRHLNKPQTRRQPEDLLPSEDDTDSDGS